MLNGEISDDSLQSLAVTDVGHLIRLWPKIRTGQDSKSELQIESVETSRTLESIGVNHPGHFKKASVLRKPFKRVFFASTDIGTPSVEEAMFRGHCAANNVLESLDDSFEYEDWSKCPELGDFEALTGT